MSTAVMRDRLKSIPRFKPGDIESSRALQDRLGKLMTLAHRMDTERAGPLDMGLFMAGWEIPKAEPGPGVLLYLHGGGFVAGDLPYARGLGSVLAVNLGRRVFCAAYRLAPENPFPAALEDALASYKYLLDQGYGGKDIALIGESAGGGLILSLCIRLRELGLPLPACLIPISPFTDMTMSGESYVTNKLSEKSLSREMIEYYISVYAPGLDLKAPLLSPLFAKLDFLPPCLIFAGGEELMLSDATELHRRLVEQGVDAGLQVEEKLWHGYVMYGIPEARAALGMISEFLNRHMGE